MDVFPSGWIWIGVSFFVPNQIRYRLKYLGATPCIGGTQATWHDELEDAAHNQMVEYVTRSGNP